MLKGFGDVLSDKVMELQKDQFSKKTYGDYVPLKVAQRIYRTVKFSI